MWLPSFCSVKKEVRDCGQGPSLFEHRGKEVAEPVGGIHYSCLEVPGTPSPVWVPVTLLRGRLIPTKNLQDGGSVWGWEGKVTLTVILLGGVPTSLGAGVGFKDSKPWSFTVAGHEEQLADDKCSR